ncbi:MAG TPA: amino acid ABC transporter permease [Acetobacteraceae bacterium]|nr:amino acid ABC transporter permease [Acetobacteraceae bacterium]
MDYVFHFGVVFAAFEKLARGALLTLELSVGAMASGLLIGCLCAVAAVFAGRVAASVVRVYVEAIRNTPFLIQLFFIYFGLPSLGLGLEPVQAALIGMSINCGAYATEIIRAGILAIPRGQIEAARALALRTRQIVRHVVLRPALRIAYPALTSQFVLVMLGSSVVSTISAEELTATGHVLETETFRPFEVYIVVTAIYVAMAFGLKALFAGLHRRFLA